MENQELGSPPSPTSQPNATSTPPVGSQRVNQMPRSFVSRFATFRSIALRQQEPTVPITNDVDQPQSTSPALKSISETSEKIHNLNNTGQLQVAAMKFSSETSEVPQDLALQEPDVKVLDSIDKLQPTLPEPLKSSNSSEHLSLAHKKLPPSSPPSPSPPTSSSSSPTRRQPEQELKPHVNLQDLDNHKKQNNGGLEARVSSSQPVVASSFKKNILGQEAALERMGTLSVTGDNTGAYMNLGNGSKGEGRKHEPFAGHSQRIATHEKTKTKTMTDATWPMAAVVNNNMQGVNNSIVFHGTCTQGSPGIHIKLPNSKKHHEGEVMPPQVETSDDVVD